VISTLRLRDGETGLIGGLLLGRDARSFSGAIGVNNIPVIGKLFGDNRRTVEESEVLISITPRIVRAPKVTEDDMVPLRIGTQEVPKVEGVGPPLFGTEPEPAAPEAGPPQAPGEAAPAGPRPLTTPAPAAAAPAPPTTAPLPGAGLEGVAPSGAAADTRPTGAILSPPEVVLQVGQNGAVAVVVVGGRDLTGVELTVAWDATLAEVTDVAAGSLLSLDGVPVAAERALETGRARVKFSRATGVTGSGAVAALTLRGLKPGSGTLVVESLALVHASGTERPTPPAPGRLVVAP
jgi:general secretion pathway protein D